MAKITFIGAGSLIFTRNLVRDILTFPALADATLSLVDLNPERLEFARAAVQRIVDAGGYPARVETSREQRRALDGADAVLCTIMAQPASQWRSDIEIPKWYGVDINIGDTRGPSGILRMLRTLPAMLSICRDIAEVCPNATFLNYTNPMAMLCRAMQGEFPQLRISGLCHSVQGTAAMLAGWIGAPLDEITYRCAGINHQAFYLQYQWKGEDAYPLIRAAVEKPEIYNKEIVRNEMFRHLGYYVTESSGHNSEYNAWFRKRPELIEKYCNHGTNWNPGVYAYSLKNRLKQEDGWREDAKAWLEREDIDLKRGQEYAASIINAISGDGTPFAFNGNVRNFGLIDNLPHGCCVEVPMYADRRGLNPIRVGALPAHLAALAGQSAASEELAVQGGLTGDARQIFYAFAYDPLTAAVLSLAEIREMTREMLTAAHDALPQFKTLDL